MLRFWNVMIAILVVIIVVGAVGFLVFRDADIPRADIMQQYSNEHSQFIELSEGIVAHIRDEGLRDGPTLFLIHGSNASLHTWESWVSELGGDFRLVSIDLPGHGLTGRVAGDSYSTVAMADFVLRVADALQIDHFALAGNSMGGEVSLRIALTAPSRVLALVLISSAGMVQDDVESVPLVFRLTASPWGRIILRHMSPRGLFRNALRDIVATPDRFVTEAMIDRYRDLTLMAGTREANIKRYRDYAAGLRQPIEAHLDRLALPVLILWGAHDSLILPRYGERMRDAIEGSELIVYADAGHLAMEEIPIVSAAAARAFLRPHMR